MDLVFEYVRMKNKAVPSTLELKERASPWSKLNLAKTKSMSNINIQDDDDDDNDGGDQPWNKFKEKRAGSGAELRPVREGVKSWSERCDYDDEDYEEEEEEDGEAGEEGYGEWDENGNRISSKNGFGNDFVSEYSRELA